MTTGTRQGRRNTGIAITQDKRGYWHFRRELPPPPPTRPRGDAASSTRATGSGARPDANSTRRWSNTRGPAHVGPHVAARLRHRHKAG